MSFRTDKVRGRHPITPRKGISERNLGHNSDKIAIQRTKESDAQRLERQLEPARKEFGYNSPEYRISKNFYESWNDADDLKKKYGKIWFVNLNRDEPVSDSVKRTTFAFDYAVANLNDKDREQLKNLVMNYRNLGSDGQEWTSREAFKRLDKVVAFLDKFPHIASGFT